MWLLLEAAVDLLLPRFGRGLLDAHLPQEVVNSLIVNFVASAFAVGLLYKLRIREVTVLGLQLLQVQVEADAQLLFALHALQRVPLEVSSVLLDELTVKVLLKVLNWVSQAKRGVDTGGVAFHFFSLRHVDFLLLHWVAFFELLAESLVRQIGTRVLFIVNLLGG